ncbi:MAG: hypothetical protein FRX49_11450, partial [Trebouxia sp. A1-2]
MALGRDRMVGLQPSSGSGLKQNSFLLGGSMTLGAGPALEQLKKTADRMVEEQQSTKHATEAYRLKLQEVQRQLAELQQSYTQEKTENTQLKAKIKDDQKQIECVTSKVSMVETMHDGLRMAMSSLRTDVQNGINGSDLSAIVLNAFGNKVEQLQTANANAHEKLTSALQHCEELKEHIVQLTASMEHNSLQHQHKCQQLAKELDEAERSVAEHRQVGESLKAELSKTLHDLSALQTSHAAQTNQYNKQVSEQEEKIQAARLHIVTVESDVKDTLARASTAEETVVLLNHTIDDLKTQLHVGSEQTESLRSDLLAKVAQHNALVEEHRMSLERCHELSTSLQQSEEALQAKVADFEQAVSSLEAQTVLKESLAGEHDQIVRQVAELQSLITTAGENAAKAQESHSAAITALQAELADSKQETLSAKADGDLSVKEAVLSADKKELEDFRRKCKAEAEKEQKKMQSQLLVLEEQKKTLDAKVAQEHEQLEAATALHKVLSDKIQQVTTSLEQKCKDEVTRAEQKIAELQVTHAKETGMLTEKQQLELQQARDAGAKQQESIANLEKLMIQLRLDNEQLVNKHILETESSLKEAEEAKKTAVKAIEAALDARVQDLLGDLSDGQRILEVTSSKLQRSELSVNAAQLELDNLKAHVREQDDIIVGLHEQLQANQALLGTISRAANQHAKPIGHSPAAAKESPSGRKKGSETKRSPVHESNTVSKRTHKGAVTQEEVEQTGEEYCDKGRNRRGKVQTAPERRRTNPPPRFASAQKKPEAAHESSEGEEQEASSDDGGDYEEEKERVYQMEKEKRKRAAPRAPKQRINKKGRSEKPAVTQGRRSKFTAMSAQTMTSEDDDGDTYQHRRKGSKADRNVAISARAKQTIIANKRLPANGRLKVARVRLALVGSAGLFERMATGHSSKSSSTPDWTATLKMGPPAST